MTTKIQSIGFTAKQELTDFISEKTAKLFRLFPEALSCEVDLKIEKSDTRENKVGSIRLVAPGNDLFSEARSNTFEEAIMIGIEALERQIRKRKTKLENAIKRNPFTKKQITS